MNVESTEIVWLTAKEVQRAVRDYVKAKGFKVYNHTQVTGLEAVTDDKYAVGVKVGQTVLDVP